jgi:DNA repair exonuclease SbcCD ATPase subunit
MTKTAMKIRAWNFRSFRQLSYTINPAGLVAVEGMYEGTKDRSNGAGKSTFLPELLCWAIYGETTGGKKQVCSTYPDADEVRVEVELPFVSWARTQKRDGTGNNVEIADIRNYTDAQVALLKYFPPKKVFASTMILGQGVGERFSAWTPGTRAQALSELLNLSIWTEARKKLSGDRTRLKGDLAHAQGAIGVYQAQYSELSKAPRGDPKRRSAASKKVAKLSGDLGRLQTEYSTCNQNAVSCAQTLGQWSAQMAGWRQEIQRLQSEAAGVSQGANCPTCNRPYAKNQIAAMVKQLRAREKAAAQSLKDMEQEHGKLEKAAQENKAKLDQITPTLTTMRSQLSQAEQELAQRSSGPRTWNSASVTSTLSIAVSSRYRSGRSTAFSAFSTSVSSRCAMISGSRSSWSNSRRSTA